jgi:hypothetical protein
VEFQIADWRFLITENRLVPSAFNRQSTILNLKSHKSWPAAALCPKGLFTASAESGIV